LIENSEGSVHDKEKNSTMFRVKDMFFKRYYDMTNPVYRAFMIEVVQNLEPYHQPTGVLLVNELDEVGEILFVQKGGIGVGYEINRMKRIVLQFTNRYVIGAFYATFNQRSNFIYCTTSDMESYFIRRFKWLEILDENALIATDMKLRIF